MMLKLFLSLSMLLLSSQASALKCNIVLEVKAKKTQINSRNFKKSLIYLDYRGLKIPYVDLKPTGRSNGKTVFLAAGFSKNMRSWLPHMRLLTQQGFRVVSFDQTNVGYNLLENGIQKLDRGTGLAIDSDMAFAVLKDAGVTKKLSILGHSRGGAVASRLALLATRDAIKVEQLLLLTPYVRYVWSPENPMEAFGESVYDRLAETYPQYYGKFLYDESKLKKFEEIKRLPKHSIEAALVYVLKGLKLNGEPEVTTADVLDAVLAEKTKIKISVYAAENDGKLAPAETVSELEREGVLYHLVKGKTKDHYWPLHYAESMLKAVGLLL